MLPSKHCCVLDCGVSGVCTGAASSFAGAGVDGGCVVGSGGVVLGLLVGVEGVFGTELLSLLPLSSYFLHLR